MKSRDHSRIFINYSRRGNGLKWKATLLEALHVFEGHGLIDVWEDDLLRVGSFWDDEIKCAIENSAVAVLLLTKELLRSKYILEREFPQIRERQEREKLIVIPIICEPCDWRKHEWLRATQSPNESRPLCQLDETSQHNLFRKLATKIADEMRRLALPRVSGPAQPPSGEHIFLEKLPVSQGPSLLKETLIGREQESVLLDLALADTETAIVTLVAWGGVGKTMLVRHWLQHLQEHRWVGLCRVYAWSFYSQGTKEDRQASEDSFLSHALKWFEVECEPGISAWEKGRLLAEEVGREPTLLILDGVEPLQYPPGPMGGQLRSPGVQNLLKRLARRGEVAGQFGLCLVTTREPLTDLNKFERRHGISRGSSMRVNLGNLTEDAGAVLLHYTGANRVGAGIVKQDHKELLAASRDVDGHALTLSLLGRFIARAHGGDICQRDKINFKKADSMVQGGHAFRMLATFERWFSNEGEIENRGLAILRLLGVFDRPAEMECISVLRQPPVIEGVCEPLFTSAHRSCNAVGAGQAISDEALRSAISFLLDFGLVAINSTDAHSDRTIDCHPLIREYFAQTVRGASPNGWREANNRLFEFLKSKAPQSNFPTIEDLEPLYHAIRHGCQAGLHKEAYFVIYRPFIRRENEFYSERILGALDWEGAAMACFFEEAWTRPASVFDEEISAWLLNSAGLLLRNQTRYGEASSAFNAALNHCMESRPPDWYNAAQDAINLSETKLWQGNLEEAEADARKAVQFSFLKNEIERKPDRQWDALSLVAHILHQRGQLDEVAALFQRAEQIKARSGTLTPLLISVPGFRYCQLLLSTAERAFWAKILAPCYDGPFPTNDLDDVEKRVAVVFKQPGDKGYSILSNALDRLTLTRLAVFRSVMGRAHLPLHGLEDLITSLRRGGDAFHVVSGLLCTSAVRFCGGDPKGAEVSLNEAWDLAERGPMRLQMADIHLYRARLFSPEKSYPWKSPQDDLAAAEKLINDCGYRRREGELADAKRAILRV